MHRLVILEGIMGSGKSRTVLYLAERLQARAIHENTDPHPVRGTDGLEHWFEPWLDVSTRQLAARALAKWQSFVRDQQKSGAVSVFDGQLFHGDLTHLMLMEAERADIEAYCMALVEAIRPLNPLVVYFHQTDIKRAIDRICAERGPDWVKYQTEWKLRAPYSKRRGFDGQEGLIALYEDYRLLTDQLYAKLDLPKMSIENSAQDWPAYYRQIEKALGLPVL